jgi:hypothetical protein
VSRGSDIFATAQIAVGRAAFDIAALRFDFTGLSAAAQVRSRKLV